MNRKSPAQESKEILAAYKSLLIQAEKALTTKERREKVSKAFKIAADAHKDMRRKSGEPYIYHPIAVAKICCNEIGLGATSIVCALLHDVVEDTDLTLSYIRTEFDDNVADIIEGLTKIDHIFDVSGSVKAENIRKILLTLAKDVRVVLIKLADRLHNMRTMDAMPRHKQIKIASETQYLYVPLAHRLGLYAIKSELEDLNTKYTEPEVYREIIKKLIASKKVRAEKLNNFIEPIKKELKKKKIKCEIKGRPKSVTSILNKMRAQHISFEQVYDKSAIRIITDSTGENEKDDCWKVYSIVTRLFKPNPDRHRDWISHPKANGYEALHTTVMGQDGNWVEVQIRSKRMDEIAEKGYAAHWKYKGDNDSESALDNWLARVRDLLEHPNPNTYDFLDELKSDLFTKEMYLFTPKGELKVLPEGSTVLDFAYDVHTEIGHKCIGAKVNHKILPPTELLKNGDQVEILTSTKQVPVHEWLSIVVTGKAKAKIKDGLKAQRKKLIRKGKQLVAKVFKNKEDKEAFDEILEHYYLDNAEDLYYRLGTNEIEIDQFKKLVKGGATQWIRKKWNKTKINLEQRIKRKLLANNDYAVFGEKAGEVDYKVSDCCNPIPGDEVVGFINANDDVEVHKSTCKKVNKILSKYDYKVVKTALTKEHKVAFLSEIVVKGKDDVGVMQRILSVISGQLQINMRSLKIDSESSMFIGKIKVFVEDKVQLEQLIKKLKKVKGILSVSRSEV